MTAEALQIIPIIGPLLADPEGRKWLLWLILLVGIPMRDVEKGEDGKNVVTWHFRGALRIAWTAARGIDRGGERLEKLELAVTNLIGVVRERIPKHPDHADTIRPPMSSVITAEAPISRRN